MNDIERYREMLKQTQRKLDDSNERIDALEETCLHIEADLSSTLPEYVETTGEQPHMYYGWRRRAKTALFHKQQALRQEKNHQWALRTQVARLEMIVKAMESGYRGEDEVQLLRAMLHLVNDIVTSTSYDVDEEQQGLLAVVSHRLGNLEVASVA